MVSVLFGDNTQRVVIIPYRRSGHPIGPIFKGQESYTRDRQPFSSVVSK